MVAWKTSAKAVLVFVTAIAYTPIVTPGEAFADPVAASTVGAAGLLSEADDSDGPDDSAGGSDEDDAPPPCRPGNAPSAVTGRCVPDFPEHECPDGGMSIWNRCPRGVPCDSGGLSVNGECPGPTQRFCDDGVSFEGSCSEDAASREDAEPARVAPFVSSPAQMSPQSPVFG